MGRVYPFSEIENCLTDTKSQAKGCVVDTSFLIAVVYELDPFNEGAVKLFDALAEAEIPLYSTVTSKSEYLERCRRIILTEALLEMRAQIDHLQLGPDVYKELKNLKQWVDDQLVLDRQPVAHDRRLKTIKRLLSRQNPTNENAWLKMCELLLRGKVKTAWEEVTDLLGITHLDLGDPSIQSLVPQKVTWDRAFEICEASGMGLYDSMIVNMLNCSIFPVAVSTDFDFAYAALSGSTDKSILIPDEIAAKCSELIF
jgi:predicted nucleic acid-binding protein